MRCFAMTTPFARFSRVRFDTAPVLRLKVSYADLVCGFLGAA
jgi:hypothetical protein